MKELELEFKGRGEVKGYIFTQILKSDKAYMYLVFDNDIDLHFEVFERKINTNYDCISYPKSKSFGKWAWCFNNYIDALNKFNTI